MSLCSSKKETVEALRREMRAEGIAAYIILSEDAHQSEYVAPYWRGRAYVSGFTGSAGTLVVTLERAALWTDGRYFLQAAAQLEGSGIELMKSGEPGVPSWPSWILAETAEGGVVGIDGRTLGASAAARLNEAFSAKKLGLKSVDLTDRVWPLRPALPEAPIFDFPALYTGETRRDRLARLRAHMKKLGADYYLICSLESSAWLLNYRGSDIADTPVAYAYTLVSEDDAVLFIEESKVPEALRASLAEDGVRLCSYHKAAAALEALPASALAYDPALISLLFEEKLPACVKKLPEKEAPLLWRAVKTETEIANLREAHLRDGAIMCRFIRWTKQNAAGKREDELAEVLDTMRREADNSLGISFESIVGYEDNGAIIHYAPEKGKGRTVEAKGFLLVDSGAQFYEGTTDITRTLSVGPLTEKQKKIYTLVLKGHLRLGAAVFREGTSGPKLDILAREALWENGLDYKHGTGHGIGFVLSVHEGPHTINGSQNNVALVPGMIVSNEPGFYEAGEFGVRIENVVAVRERSATEWGRFFEFETLTLVPYEREAIEPSLLTAEERAAVDRYHERVLAEVGPRLSGEDLAWLKEACAPL